ncbi:pyridoxal phosphate-dependent aminotransferase family protein [Fibrobacterales bacterium]|nr:pyridoxal phosphate-dependent aminotransferase family protein [Fibrobacterales bacterium]
MLKELLSKKLSLIKNTANFRQLYPSSTPSGKTFQYNDKSYIQFSSNNYLGIANHPSLSELSNEFTQKFGTGSGGSRLLGGAFDFQEELENQISTFMESDDSLFFNNGYQANLSFAHSISQLNIPIYWDKLCHASIIDGLSLGKNKNNFRFAHNNTEHLLELIEKNGPGVIICEALYSMDGDIADLEALAWIAIQNNCTLYIDEAHSIGATGPNGKGLCKYFSLPAQTQIIRLGTFGKALGGHGAWISGSKELISWLKNTGRAFIFSTATSPAVFGAAKASLELLPQLDQEREHLQNLGIYLRQQLKINSWDTLNSEYYIIPILIGCPKKAQEAAHFLQSQGLWVQAIRTPTVPKGTDRLRINLCSHHSFNDLDLLISGLKKWSSTQND